MAREDPTWGRRRIQAELRFLGYEVSELTVAKYMRLRRDSTLLQLYESASLDFIAHS